VTSPISSSAIPFQSAQPRVYQAITKFIDALVNLSIDPNTKFHKSLNGFVASLPDGGYYESHKIFENPNFSKIISPRNLIVMAKYLIKEIIENENIDTNNKSPKQIAKLLEEHLRANTDLDLINILAELKRSYDINLSYLLWKTTPKPGTNKDLLLEDLFKKHPFERFLRKSAESFEKDFENIMKVDEHVPWYEFLIPKKSFESIAQNRNIIPAYKILTLRPLVKSLQGWLKLSEDDLLKQVAQELNSQLQQKAPNGYKADYEKLALAVFPQDVAGRLRAAGFGMQQQA
jgi:hypothetical protein